MEEKTKPQARTRDLGKGSIPKLLAQLAIPVVVAQIVNLLYNIVDRIYIGHIPGIGAAALTGVGLFAPILMLINAFAMLSGFRRSTKSSNIHGKKDNETAEKDIGKLAFIDFNFCSLDYHFIFYFCTKASYFIWS